MRGIAKLSQQNNNIPYSSLLLRDYCVLLSRLGNSKHLVKFLERSFFQIKKESELRFFGAEGIRVWHQRWKITSPTNISIANELHMRVIPWRRSRWSLTVRNIST